MTIWQNYISAYRSMLPMKIEGLWAGWEGKGTYLNAITHSHPQSAYLFPFLSNTDQYSELKSIK